ncbi:MAG: zinc ribbon domain-containing protein [Lachnospiraceae bacterium]|nr:zinc ribbon domain-containing protein [Lachnospiraceae bacterium]
MKCPNCGAEIEANSRKCSYCDTVISAEMQRENELLQKKGCPKCNSTNVTFTRENQGELRGKNAKRIVHKTVGLCKDCGYTWYSDVDDAGNGKRRKTWLWVLGWIFIFPVPLTILLLRKKEMNPVLKYGIIGLAFALYLLWVIVGANSSGDKKQVEPIDNNKTETVKDDVKDDEIKNDEFEFDFVIENDELGEYGKIFIFNEGTEFEDKEIEYFISAGTYIVKNISGYQGQFAIQKDEVVVNDDGWEEPGEVKEVYIIKPGDEIEFTIEEGYYLDINLNGTLAFKKIR